jgi:hypothetical protein
MGTTTLNKVGRLFSDSTYMTKYDFTQAGVCISGSQEALQSHRGDSFNVVCYYNEEPFGVNRTLFGVASFQEMCMAFLWYYPRVPTLPGLCGPGVDQLIPGICGSNFTYNKLEDESDSGRTFGKASDVCSSDIHE